MMAPIYVGKKQEERDKEIDWLEEMIYSQNSPSKE